MRNERGFTIIELLAVVSIISLLATIAIQEYEIYRMRARIGVTATEMKSFASGFVAYLAEHKRWPPDSHAVLPAGMEKYISQTHWDEETPIGGHYNWEGPENYPYAGLSIFQPAATIEQLEILDGMLDDGQLGTGRFRLMGNGRPTLVIETN